MITTWIAGSQGRSALDVGGQNSDGCTVPLICAPHHFLTISLFKFQIPEVLFEVGLTQSEGTS